MYILSGGLFSTCAKHKTKLNMALEASPYCSTLRQNIKAVAQTCNIPGRDALNTLLGYEVRTVSYIPLAFLLHSLESLWRIEFADTLLK
jgi:hypothetical protein